MNVIKRKTQITRLALFAAALLTALASAGGHAAPRAGAPSTQYETRCGWFSNPTPANMWLHDRDGQWIIGAQGGYQVEGDWKWPAFKRPWVRTNGNYGYGCACLELRVDKKTGHVLEIKRARARPLASCRRDRALSKWRDKLD